MLVTATAVALDLRRRAPPQQGRRRPGLAAGHHPRSGTAVGPADQRSGTASTGQHNGQSRGPDAATTTLPPPTSAAPSVTPASTTPSTAPTDTPVQPHRADRPARPTRPPGRPVRPTRAATRSPSPRPRRRTRSSATRTTCAPRATRGRASRSRSTHGQHPPRPAPSPDQRHVRARRHLRDHRRGAQQDGRERVRRRTTPRSSIFPGGPGDLLLRTLRRCGRRHGPLGATSSSGLPVSLHPGASANGACTVTGSTVTYDHAQPCTITASQAGNRDYTPPPAPETFDVGQATRRSASPRRPPRPWATATTRLTATSSSGPVVSLRPGHLSQRRLHRHRFDGDLRPRTRLHRHRHRGRQRRLQRRAHPRDPARPSSESTHRGQPARTVDRSPASASRLQPRPSAAPHRHRSHGDRNHHGDRHGNPGRTVQLRDHPRDLCTVTGDQTINFTSPATRPAARTVHRHSADPGAATPTTTARTSPVTHDHHRRQGCYQADRLHV